MTAVTTQTLTLTEFLLARLAEDEAAAHSAIDPERPGIHWQWVAPDGAGDPGASRWLQTAEEFPTTSGVGPLPAFPLGFECTVEPSRGMEHIARHDPARVLADVEAKRRIVRGHIKGHCECRSVRILASVYADHPDYREEWRA